jgi:hypothetical protein
MMFDLLENPRLGDWDLDGDHSLADGLCFFGGGRHPGSKYFHDSSLYNNHGTLTAMTPATAWVWDSYLNRYAVDFDGSNDYMVAPRPPSLKSATPWTVSMWAKFAGTPALKNMWALSDGANQLGICYWSDAFNGLIIRAGTNTDNTAQPASDPTITNLHHWVFTWNGNITTQATIWIDGITNSQNISTVLGDYDSNAFYLSRGLGDAYQAPMRVADLLIWNRVLSPAWFPKLADPAWSVDYGGLIRGPRLFRGWKAAAAGGATITWPWQHRRHRRMAGVS